MPRIHKPAMWFLSFGQLFGWSRRVGLVVLKESPALGILFLDMISEGRFVNIHSVVGHNDSWHIHLLAQMIVLITCCNGLTGDLIFGRWSSGFIVSRLLLSWQIILCWHGVLMDSVLMDSMMTGGLLKDHAMLSWGADGFYGNRGHECKCIH